MAAPDDPSQERSGQNPGARAPEMPTDEFHTIDDRLTGQRVVVIANRQKRPNLPQSGCPFCPGGLESPEKYVTSWFPNRWPALPDQRAEVVLYTPEHTATLASLGETGVRRVVELWAQRYEALGAREDVAYVLEFENRGPEVGATIAHPHGQIYAFDHVPAFPARELAMAGPCALCEPPPAPNIVSRTGSWTAWVPEAAVWPYELRIAPDGHLPHLPAAAPSWDDLAAVLVDGFGRLDRLFDAPMPYMMFWHQQPTDGQAWPNAHVHLHVTPLLRAPGVARFVAAAEWGAEEFFNPVPPETAAANLRGV